MGGGRTAFTVGIHRLFLGLALGAGSARAESPVLYPEARAVRSINLTGESRAEALGTHSVRVSPTPRSRLRHYFLNPFLAFDVGLSPDPRLPPPPAYDEALSWLVHATPAREASREISRLGREGRAAPTGFVAWRSYHGQMTLSLARVIQKGDLATGRVGGSRDGQLHALHALQEMIDAEILHRHGVFGARILLAGELEGVERKVEAGERGGPAGVALRVGERLRGSDRNVPRYFGIASVVSPDWTHPLIVSGLESQSPARRGAIVASLNEGILKDLWALHGSLIPQNRSEAMIDLGTFAFLSEPNPGAHTGGATGYWDEVRSWDAKTQNGEWLPKEGNFFKDAFAFHQLRRLGLPDQEILARFFQKEGRDGLVAYRAKPETVALARAILSLDETVEPVPEAPFRANPLTEHKTEYRVIFNTRKLLRRFLEEPRYLGTPGALPESEIRGILESSRNELFADSFPLDGRLAVSRATVFQAVEKIHHALGGAADYFHSRRPECLERARQYPVHQTLPSREEIVAKAEQWRRDPMSFLPGFLAYIESFDPPDRTALRAHYEKHAPASTHAASLFRKACALSRL